MEELEDFQALEDVEELEFSIREAVNEYQAKCIKVVEESPIGRLPIADHIIAQIKAIQFT